MPGLTFRTEALEKLNSPEQLDQLMRVTTFKGWLALAGLFCLLVPIFAWGLWGSLETRASAQGMLLPAGGLCIVSAPSDGQVTEVLVGLGQEIREGQVVVRLRLAVAGSPPQDVPGTCSGKVVDISVRPGDTVQRGVGLMTIEPAGQPLEVVAYLPLVEARSVAPGMPARIALSGVQTGVYGYLLGEVRSVSQFPVDPQELARQVGSQSLAQDLLRRGTLVEVNIDLGGSRGAYQWSLNRVPGQPLTSGTPCQVSILLDRRAPVELIFPSLSQ